jgi:hypothetical protein
VHLIARRFSGSTDVTMVTNKTWGRNRRILKLILPTYKITGQRKKSNSIIKIIWLMLVTEIFDVYSKKHMKYINTLHGQNLEFPIVKGVKIYRWVLKD